MKKKITLDTILKTWHIKIRVLLIKAKEKFADKKYGNKWSSHLIKFQDLYCLRLDEEVRAGTLFLVMFSASILNKSLPSTFTFNKVLLVLPCYKLVKSWNKLEQVNLRGNTEKSSVINIFQKSFANKGPL